jgi:hypothetical protein
MADQHGDGSGWDKSRWGSGQDRSGWDKSAWAEASREDAEQSGQEQSGQEQSGQEQAGAGGDEAGRDVASRDSASRDSAGRDSTQRDSTQRDSTQRDSTQRGSTQRNSAQRGSGSTRRDNGQLRRSTRPRQSQPGSEMLTDFQRWLLRSGAKSMRRELSDQVRRTVGGGRRKESGNVGDVATTEIPPEVGESPECQWCPICRAARAMRDSGPSLGDHLSTAGDMVAGAVQEALRGVDSVLSRTSAGGQRSAPPDDWREGDEGWVAARDNWAAAHGAIVSRPDKAEPADEPARTDDDNTDDDNTDNDNTDNPSAENRSADTHGEDDQTEGPDEPDDRR